MCNGHQSEPEDIGDDGGPGAVYGALGSKRLAETKRTKTDSDDDGQNNAR